MDPTHRVSTKLSKFRPSLTLALKTLVGERLEQNLPVYDFGLGETKGHLDDEIREAGERAFREQDTMYSDPAGIPKLRREVLKWLHVDQQRHVRRECLYHQSHGSQSVPGRDGGHEFPTAVPERGDAAYR